MTKSPIRQHFALGTVFLLGGNLLVGSSYRAAQDSWISALVAAALLIVWGLLLWRISRLAPQKGIVALLDLFPVPVRNALTVAVGIYCLSQSSLILRAYAGFAHTVSLQRTDEFFLIVLSCAVVFVFVKGEKRILLRFSYLALIPILLTVALLFFFLIPHFRWELLFPMFYENTSNVILCTAEDFSYPFGNAFLLLGLYSRHEDRGKEGALWLTSCASAGLVSFLIVVQNILLLGGKLCASLEYPNNFAASIVNVGDFFSRVEVVASLVFYLSAIVRVSLFMRTAADALGVLTPVSKKEAAFPLTLLLLGHSAVLFQNTESLFHYLRIFPMLALPFQLGLPLSIWLILEFRVRRRSQVGTRRPHSILL